MFGNDDNIGKASEFPLERMEYGYIGGNGTGTFMYSAVNAIGGASGSSKSQIINDIAIWHAQRGMASLIDNTEDAKSVQRARIQAQIERMGLSTELLDLIHFVRRPYLFPNDTERLLAEIEEWNIKFASFDTLSKHLLAPMANDQRVAQALDPVAAVAQHTKSMLMFVTHTLKSAKAKDDPLDVFGGSRGGIVGTSRVCAVVGQFDNGEGVRTHRGLQVVKDSNRDWPAPILYRQDGDTVLDPETGIQVDDAGFLTVEEENLPVADRRTFAMQLVLGPGKAAGNSEGRSSEKRNQAAEWLLGELGFGYVEVNDLKARAKEADISWSTVRKAEEKDERLAGKIEKPVERFQKKDEHGNPEYAEDGRPKMTTVVRWQLVEGHESLSPNAPRWTPPAPKKPKKGEKCDDK